MRFTIHSGTGAHFLGGLLSRSYTSLVPRPSNVKQVEGTAVTQVGSGLSPSQRLLGGGEGGSEEREGALGATGRGKGEELSFPFPAFHASSLFPTPQPPNCLHGRARKRPLRRREGSGYEISGKQATSAPLGHLGRVLILPGV